MTPQPEISAALRQAIAAAETGQFAAAETACGHILAERPDDAAALCFAGALAARRGETEAAIARYRAALAAAPRFVKALSNLGAALSDLGRFEEAEIPLALALEEDPAHGPATINLAQVRLAQGRIDEAIALGRNAVELAPSDVMAWNNLGAAYLRAERVVEAQEALRQAVACDARSAAAWSNFGNAAHRLGRHAEAAAAFRAAAANGAPPAEAAAHLGAALRGMGDYGAALAAYERALALKPDLAEARFSRALLLLAEGRFAEGWSDYRARPSGRAFRARQGVRDTPRLAADLSNRKILLEANQGFGDELFFLRYAAFVKARGATVLYRAGGKLAPLARRVVGIDEVLDEAAIASADVALLVDDLPYALGENGTPPALSLAPAADKQAALRLRLAACGPAPYLGVTWRGGVDRHGALFKEAPRAEIAKLAAAWPGTVLSLQRAPHAGETAAFAASAGCQVADLSALNDDLDDMLALLSLLEEYVAVSNTNVHLRQSLGRGSRVLVPMPPDWRWMNAGEESPWFPRTKLYRQMPDGGWSAAFARLATDLARRPHAA